ncbi:MAG: hypothetical protein AAGF11_27670 [Myxococcota bacterium]
MDPEGTREARGWATGAVIGSVTRFAVGAVRRTAIGRSARGLVAVLIAGIGLGCSGGDDTGAHGPTTDSRGDAMTTGDADDTASIFVQAPDGGVQGECDPFAQDCAAGQKCTSYVATEGQSTVDATRCVPATGDDGWDEPCERTDDNDTCAPGLFCMTEVSGGTGPGTCLEYCSLDTPCQFGGECFAFNDGVLPICQPTCDPLAQDCPDEQGCYVAFGGFLCSTPGPADGEGDDGSACATVQSCLPGLVCRPDTAGCAEAGACCTPWCALDGDGPPCPSPSEECLPALDDPPPDRINVGYCGLPP